MASKKSRTFKVGVIAGVVAAVMLIGTALAFAVAPLRPTATAVDTEVGNQVRVGWSKDLSAASWKLEYKKASAAEWTEWRLSDPTTTTATVTGLENGTAYEFQVEAYSLTGEPSGWSTAVQASPSDKTAPVTAFEPAPKTADGLNGWYVSWPDYQFAVNEAPEATVYNVNGGPVNELTAKTATAGSSAYKLVEGVNRIDFRSTDKAGNVEASKSATISVDVTKPVVGSVVAPAVPNGDAGWYTSAPTVDLTATDGHSGVASLSYVWNAGSAVATDAATTVAKDMPQGKNVLTFKSTDKAGHSSVESTVTISLDSIAPSVPSGLSARAMAGGDIAVSWSASTDADSGVNGYTVAYSGAATGSVEATAGQTSVILPTSCDGTVTVKATASDIAGNESEASAALECVADAVAPIAAISPADGVAPWGTKSAEATISATDTGLGVNRMAWVIARPDATVVSSGTVVGGAPKLVPMPEGACELQLTVYDNAGNAHYASAAFSTDWTAPTSSFSALPAEPNGDNGWYRSIAATISAVDAPEFGSGVADMTVNGVKAGGSKHIVTPKPGDNEFVFVAVDAAGNRETTKTASFKFDDVAPKLDVDFGSYVAGAPVSADVTASVSATDAVSGVDRIEVQAVAAGAETTSTGWSVIGVDHAEFTAPAGDLDIYFRAVDKAGNVVSADPVHVIVDKQAPVTTLTTDPADADGANGTWLTKPTITLKAEDLDGYTIDWSLVRPTEATMTGSVDKPNSAVIAPAEYFSTAGTYTLQYRAVDGAGNAEATKTASFFVDPGQPVVDFSVVAPNGLAGWHTIDPTATVSAVASDDTTIAAIYYRIGGGTYAKVDTRTADFKAGVEGSVKLEAYAEDVNGRRGPASTVDYKVDTVAPVFSGLKAKAFNTRKPVLTIAAEDKTSGLTSAADANGTSFSFESYTSATPVLANVADGYSVTPDIDLTVGEHKLVGALVDQAGNVTAIEGAYFRIDLGAPVVSVTEGSVFDGKAVLQLKAIDALTGVAKIIYKVDGGAEVEVDGDIADLTISDAGDHKVEFWAVDVAGNASDVAVKELTVNSNTALSLSMPSIVEYSKQAPISATIKDANAKPVVGKTVRLLRSTDNKSWTQVAQAVSNTNGVADFGMRSVVAGKRNYFKAEFDQSGAYFASTAAKSLQMRASLGAPSIASKVAKNKYYAVKGGQKSLAKGAALRVYVYKYNTKTKKYDYVRYYAAKTTSTSAFSGSVRFSSAGKYRIRTYYAGSANGAAGAWSSYRYTTVK